MVEIKITPFGLAEPVGSAYEVKGTCRGYVKGSSRLTAAITLPGGKVIHANAVDVFEAQQEGEADSWVARFVGLPDTPGEQTATLEVKLVNLESEKVVSEQSDELEIKIKNKPTVILASQPRGAAPPPAPTAS